MSVGIELLNEIERVAGKRERWKQYSIETPEIALGLKPGIALMGLAIERAKDAIANNDAVASIAALEDLRGYDSDD